MGGGDLNMKKSWHPNTAQNLEKVWKAEQKRDSEKKKIGELQSELNEERAREEVKQQAIDAGLRKKSDKVDWMYKKMTIDREQYLLGKKVDKHANPLFDPEQERRAESGPGALFAEQTLSVSVEMANKIREDPLFAIKKKEHEHRKALLNNPIKMKRMQEMLRSDISPKKKKDKKEKKHKHKHRHHTDESDDEDRDRDRRKRRARDRSRSRSRSPHRRRSKHGRHSPSPVRTQTRTTLPNYRQRPRRLERRRIDAGEMERKRTEMMQNARDRDVEREERVRRHREDVDREELEMQEKSSKDVKFIRSLTVASYSSAGSSVEDRIKRNIHSVQRTSASLSKNFVKRDS
eukprot:m.187671 g.187671  ORF g.187671 m.187671 type:complete len:347 (+) comp39366_c0_seq19:91-1131(+)